MVKREEAEKKQEFRHYICNGSEREYISVFCFIFEWLGYRKGGLLSKMCNF